MILLFMGLFILFVLFLGPTNAFRALPFIFILWLLFSFFGFIIINFFPVILILLIVSYFRNKNNPKSTGRTHYYHFGGNADFDEFFRKNGGQNSGHYQRTGGGYAGNNFGGFEDTTKYYNLLGINKGATQEEVKKAYREMARKHHPDKYATADDDVKDYHEKKFKEINEAYEKLTRGAL